MRKFTSFLSVFTLLLFAITTLAQDVLVVEPGVGTLNAAIAANGGNKIYQLKAGQWYQLDGIIENVDYHLQIIGENPTNGGMPATLQTNADAEGAVFGNMFNAFGDISIKGIYVVNADLTGVVGGPFITQNDSLGRIVVDGCILDPVSNGNAIILSGAKTCTYFTNNLVLRMGHQLNPNDGHFFVANGTSGVGLDTLYVENNTFVCMGTNMFAGNFNAVVHGYIKFNHNTWVMQKSQIDWSVWEESFIFTNNLMFDFNTQVWAANWQPMPGADVSQPKPALIYADTIPGETLPSVRQQFWEYNMLYRNPKFYDLINELNVIAVDSGKPVVNYMPLLWPVDSINAINPNNIPRETVLFADDVDFPNWKEGNNKYNLDPQFEDTRIYEHSDKFVEWTRPASLIHALGFPSDRFPPASQWAQYWWDLDGDPSINEAWPVFNGKYTNPELLKASIENLPLGDLNWFPEAKAKWASQKDDIDAHIHAGNEGKFIFTGIKSDLEVNRFSVNIFPNPVSNQFKLSKVVDVVTVSDIAGRQLRKLINTDIVSVKDLKTGIYFVSYELNGQVGSQKITVQK